STGAPGARTTWAWAAPPPCPAPIHCRRSTRLTMAEPLTLDVREELRGGGEPLPRLLQAVRDLAPGQALRLLATFEPLPLYALLARKGFGHRAVRVGEGDWEVLFA